MVFLGLYVCMRCLVCMWVLSYTPVFVLHVCMSMSMHVCTYVRLFIFAHVRSFLFMHVCMYVCVYVSHVGIHTPMYGFICMQDCTHACIIIKQKDILFLCVCIVRLRQPRKERTPHQTLSPFNAAAQTV